MIGRALSGNNALILLSTNKIDPWIHEDARVGWERTEQGAFLYYFVCQKTENGDIFWFSKRIIWMATSWNNESLGWYFSHAWIPHQNIFFLFKSDPLFFPANVGIFTVQDDWFVPNLYHSTIVWSSSQRPWQGERIMIDLAARIALVYFFWRDDNLLEEIFEILQFGLIHPIQFLLVKRMDHLINDLYQSFANPPQTTIIHISLQTPNFQNIIFTQITHRIQYFTSTITHSSFLASKCRSFLLGLISSSFMFASFTTLFPMLMGGSLLGLLGLMFDIDWSASFLFYSSSFTSTASSSILSPYLWIISWWLFSSCGVSFMS